MCSIQNKRIVDLDTEPKIGLDPGATEPVSRYSTYIGSKFVLDTKLKYRRPQYRAKKWPRTWFDRTCIAILHFFYSFSLASCFATLAYTLAACFWLGFLRGSALVEKTVILLRGTGVGRLVLTHSSPKQPVPRSSIQSICSRCWGELTRVEWRSRKCNKAWCSLSI